MLTKITRLFPLWAVLLSVAAYYNPTRFTPIAPHVSTLLMLIMLGMGITLSFSDFKRVLSRPAPVAAATFLHYLVMPLAAWLLAKHSIFVTAIVNDFIDGLRISPNVYSTVQEIDRLSGALLYAAKNGIS